MKHKAKTQAGWTLEIVKMLRKRREIDPEKCLDWHVIHGFTLGGGELFKWIELNTEGRFYFSFNTLAFEDDKDAMFFKLSYEINAK